MRKDKETKTTGYQRLVEEETLMFEATELISELLEAQEVSRKELADRLGKSKGYVTQVLAGDRNMTLKTLADLAFALGRRIELGAVPLAKGDSGIDGGARPSVVRVRAGVGDLARRSRCCGAPHPPRVGCLEASSGGTSRALWVSAHLVTGDQRSTVSANKPEFDQVAG